WLDWAGENNIHHLVLDYVKLRPDHLWSQPPKHEEPFSTPRSWHMLSDALHSFGEGVTDHWLRLLPHSSPSPHPTGPFKAFVRQVRSRYQLNAIIKGEIGWPSKPEERDVLYFLAQSLRAQLIKELPRDGGDRVDRSRELSHRGKALIKDLAGISLEIAQIVV